MIPKLSITHPNAAAIKDTTTATTSSWGAVAYVLTIPSCYNDKEFGVEVSDNDTHTVVTMMLTLITSRLIIYHMMMNHFVTLLSCYVHKYMPIVYATWHQQVNMAMK